MATKSLNSANTGIHVHVVKHVNLLAFQNHLRWTYSFEGILILPLSN